MADILLVDDERTMRDGLKAILCGEGFGVRTARDGEDALKKIAERRPDVVLLDVMMPKMNGYKCCEKIRETDKLLPVIFLTAKDAETEQLRGIGLGADDFISKTASDAVLVVRINRVLDRSAVIAENAGRPAAATVLLGTVAVDLKTFAVLKMGKEIARLTKTEADILALLNSRRGELIVPDDIITELRGNGFACEDAMLYMHISNLRKKLGPAGDMIVNKRRVGYGLLK